jgi:mono/diheme cytochrome c family protein
VSEGAGTKVVPWWRRRSFRTTVAAVASIAAALLVAWLTRDAVIERTEAREQAARLAAPDVEPPAALARLRADAHVLLAEHCAPCHDSTTAESENDAVAVFDVRADRWWLTLSDRQLGIVVDRMTNRDGMTPDVIDGIATYVAAELDFRRGG